MLPLVDIGPLLDGPANAHDVVARSLDQACRQSGFFLVHNHGVCPKLIAALDQAARRFFALPPARKAAVAMHHFGPAWRGWFPVGGELTSGVPDQKEGYYFGKHLPTGHPKVRAQTPLHGPNPFPSEVPELAELVARYLAAMQSLAATLLSGMARGLGLASDYFACGLTHDPTTLFRIFHYPARTGHNPNHWGVAEHTDYGLLTVLCQDTRGGLEVHTPAGWTAVPPVPGTLVCNLGDMLERLTNGHYRSTPHRVHAQVGTDGPGRVSLAYFYDPDWEATPDQLAPLQHLGPPPPEHRKRWDNHDPMDHQGTYGAYLTAKVANVFPELFADTLGSPSPR